VPVTVFAVAITLVWPVAPVTAAALKVASAPVVGAVKATVTFGTGLPNESVTVTSSAVVKAVPTVAVCPPPAVAVMLTPLPALLVRVKLAAVATPVTVAVTA
jgi:hypothetical protein